MVPTAIAAQELNPAVSVLDASGLRLLGSEEPRIGAHGNLFIFAHPADLAGSLTEFEELALINEPATRKPNTAT